MMQDFDHPTLDPTVSGFWALRSPVEEERQTSMCVRALLTWFAWSSTMVSTCWVEHVREAKGLGRVQENEVMDLLGGREHTPIHLGVGIFDEAKAPFEFAPWVHALILGCLECFEPGRKGDGCGYVVLCSRIRPPQIAKPKEENLQDQP